MIVPARPCLLPRLRLRQNGQLSPGRLGKRVQPPHTVSPEPIQGSRVCAFGPARKALRVASQCSLPTPTAMSYLVARGNRTAITSASFVATLTTSASCMLLRLITPGETTGSGCFWTPNSMQASACTGSRRPVSALRYHVTFAFLHSISKSGSILCD